MKMAFILISVFAGNLAFAQEGGSGLASPYSFGNACSSQGNWTQNALQATQNLRKITMQLKDDPNCKALGASTQVAIQQIEEQLKNVSDSPKRTNRLAQIPAEIEALRVFATANAPMKNQVMKLMMNRSIEGATLSAQVGASEGLDSTWSSMMSNRMQDFGDRIQRSTKTGVSVLNKVVDSIPQMDQCLTGDDQQTLGNFIAASIQVATSFAGSGQDSTGSQMATLVSKISNVVRERKYTKALRVLNQQEFLASMSCLMEVTSESYCQARDAMGLFEEGMKDIKWRQDEGKKVDATNPFLGYYVLNTHIPNITKWMQKIQIGVDPKLPTDANFQNKIQQEVADFYKSLKTLMGNYNAAFLTIRRLKSVESQQNEVLKLISSVSDAMTSGGGFSDGGAKTNFFTMNKVPIKIPFFLIGMDSVPDQVLGKAMGLPPITTEAWLAAHYNELPQFKDPVALAETIGRNMQVLGNEANLSVISYFSNWYIVDKQALVNEAVTDVNYTVKDSLRVVRDYLDVVKARVAKTGDPTVIATMRDTQERIKIVLEAFDKSEAIGKEFANKATDSKLSQEDIERAAKGSEELINTVFEKFMVMQARSGFLANRLVNDVYQDYIQLLKTEENFTEKQREIFIQAGMAAFDRMLQMYNGNPANVKSDINMALRINKGNLEALSRTLKDNMINMISQLKISSEGRSWSDNAGYRVIRDTYKQDPILAFDMSLFGLLKRNYALIKQRFVHSDRYSADSSDPNLQTSEFNDAAFLKAQLCVQALAFENQDGLRELCKGAILPTPFKDVKGYDMSYDQRLVSHLNDKDKSSQMKSAWNYSERICAFRDYNRRNMVLFMSINKK